MVPMSLPDIPWRDPGPKPASRVFKPPTSLNLAVDVTIVFWFFKLWVIGDIVTIVFGEEIAS